VAIDGTSPASPERGQHQEEPLPFDRPWLRAIERWFAPRADDPAGRLVPRWLWLRALGLIFFSAFYSLAFQIHGLVGPRGVLPAAELLRGVARSRPWPLRLWSVPSLLWIDAGDRALTLLVFLGLLASVLLVLNVLPRAMIAIAGVLFLSFVSAARVFSNYQSDGMLLEAAFISFFFAPRGLYPGLAASSPPSRASLFLLQWEWLRIYFESGIVKLASGDPQWRALTAMDHYYENGPLPTWLGWYAQQKLPHAFHAATVVGTFAVELVIVFALFLPRRFRLACFAMVTPMQIGIILTANYAFLNYLVLTLGLLLLDDRAFGRIRAIRIAAPSISNPRLFAAALALSWTFYATIASFAFRFSDGGPLAWPAQAIAPLRIANRYGLFAVMTTARYEIEFEGSRDGATWIAYPFRYKPQDTRAAPGIYAPYQPRFEWNLWFASLEDWRDNAWVFRAEARLLEGEASVLALFAGDPFGGAPPSYVRATISQYRFTDPDAKASTGAWWTREPIGPYGPALMRTAEGAIDLAP
jgi:hypothetical protein